MLRPGPKRRAEYVELSLLNPGITLRGLAARSAAAAHRSSTAVYVSDHRPEPDVIARGGTHAEGEA